MLGKISRVSVRDCGSLKWPFLNCEMTSHNWFPLSREVLNSPDISDISHHFSEENGIVKTTCVIDAVQAATYLGKAVVNIYRAEICPDGEPLGCTAPTNWMRVISFWTYLTYITFNYWTYPEQYALTTSVLYHAMIWDMFLLSLVPPSW